MYTDLSLFSFYHFFGMDWVMGMILLVQDSCGPDSKTILVIAVHPVICPVVDEIL